MPHIFSKFHIFKRKRPSRTWLFHVIVFLVDLYSVLSWSQSPCGRDETLYTLLIGSTKESVPMLLKIVWFVALRPSQQLWSCLDGQFTLPNISHFINSTPVRVTRTDMSLLAHVKLRTGDFDNFWGVKSVLKFHMFIILLRVFTVWRTGTIFLRCEELHGT